MKIRTYQLILAGLLALILISAAFAAVRYDQIVATGTPKGGASLIAGAPIDVPMGPFVTVTADTTVNTATARRGTVFIGDKAASAITFTLPAPTTRLRGHYYYFLQTRDLNMTISAGSGNVITLNNASAGSATFQGTGQKIGACGLAVCNGSKWIILSLNGPITAGS